LVTKPEGKRPRGRPTHRWDVNNEMDFEENELDVTAQIHVMQDRDLWGALVT